MWDRFFSFVSFFSPFLPALNEASNYEGQTNQGQALEKW
jgi:hypothetical protein